MFKRHYPILIIILLSFIIHSPIWLGFVDFYSGDGSDLPYVYASKMLQYKTFQNLGEIPLWNPYIMFGQPVVGNIQYSLFYPLNLIFSLIPFFKALWIHQAIHMMIAGLGAYLLTKYTGCKNNGSMIAGCLYILNGRILYYINAGWLGYFSSICWLPMFLLTSLLVMEKKGWGYPIALGVIFAMTFLAGTPQYAFLGWCLFGIHGIFYLIRCPSKEDRLSLMVRILLSGLISFLLISAQLFPALEQTYLSSRIFSYGAMHGFQFDWSLKQWLRILFRPEFLQHDFSWELCAYIGFGGILLSLLGFFISRKRLHLVIIWGLIPWLISMGSAFPPFDQAMKAVPGMSMLTNPSRFFIFTIIILSVFAGYGLERFITVRRSYRNSCLFLIITGLAFILAGLFVPKYSQAARIVDVRYFSTLVIFLTLAALYLWQGTRLLKIILICWLIADPMLLSTEILKGKYNLKDFRPPVKLIKALEQYPSQVRIAAIQPEDLRDNLLNPFDDWICVKYGIRRAGGYEPLSMLSTLNFLAQMDGTGRIKETMWGFRLWEFARPDLYNIAGITHLITFRQIENPRLKFIVQDSITMPHFHGGWWREKKVYLYENRGVLPRAFFLADSASNFVTPVAMKVVSPNRIRLYIGTDQHGKVIVSESFHPGWIASIGDKPLKVEPFLNAFISLNISPGNHDILLNFAPQSFHIGLWFTQAGLLMIILIFLYKKIRLGHFLKSRYDK